MRQHRDQRFSACAVERKAESINMARIEDDHERQVYSETGQEAWALSD